MEAAAKGRDIDDDDDSDDDDDDDDDDNSDDDDLCSFVSLSMYRIRWI